MERNTDGLWPGYTGPVMADMATLRDYFAGQALAGMATLFMDAGGDFSDIAKANASIAYQMADAMLAERDKADV